MSLLKRMNLFEWHELSWMPSLGRSLVTNYLSGILLRYRIYDCSIDLLLPLLEKNQLTHINDLCSGSGGAWLHLREQLPAHISLSLSDKNVSPATVKRLNRETGIRYLSQPVDILDVNNQFEGLQTLYSAFHHFSAKQINTFLGNIVAKQVPIAIFEVSHRGWFKLLTNFLIPLNSWFIAPLTKGNTWRHLLLTYLLPIAPLMQYWDAMVSDLRSYRVNELLALAKAADPKQQYDWQAGRIRHHWRMFSSTYLIGTPTRD